MAQVGTKVATALYAAALEHEEQLDAEIERLEKLDEDDLEEIRRKRLEAMGHVCSDRVHLFYDNPVLK